jgi:hypothetical protein
MWPLLVGHEKECLAGFNHMWLRLAPRVLSPLLCKFAWSKEGYDLLESALRTIQKLGKQLDDIHHGIQGLLEPQKASGITKLGIGVTSANVEFPRHQTQSNFNLLVLLSLFVTGFIAFVLRYVKT